MESKKTERTEGKSMHEEKNVKREAPNIGRNLGEGRRGHRSRENRCVERST